MIQRFLNSQAKSISSASLILAIFYFTSALLGLLRDRLLAGTFGAGAELDIYYAAFTVPDFVALILIFGAISAAVIPIFSSYIIKSDNQEYKEAWNYFSTLLNVFLGFLIIVCLVLIIFAPYIICLTAPGFVGAKKELAVLLMRIMFLSPIILGVSNMISGILQVFHRFLATALAPVLYNCGIIIGIIFFVPKIGIQGLAWGVVFGGILHLLVQLPALFFSGFKYKFSFNFRDPGVLKTIKLMAPRSLGLGAGQLNTIATTAIASTLISGSIAVFNFANNLSSIFLNAVAVSITTASFPAMSMAFLKKGFDGHLGEFVEKFLKILKQVLFLIIPLSLLIIILRAQIVRIVLGAGRFDWADTKLTTACLGIFAFNLIAQAIILLFSKTFYAAHNTKVPAVVSVLTVAFNIGLSLLLVWLAQTFAGFNFFLQNILRLGGVANIGVIALVLAYTITAVLESVILMYMFNKKFKITQSVQFKKDFLNFLYKILLASTVMFVFVFLTRYFLSLIVDLQAFWGLFFQLFVSGLIGVIVYAIISYLLNLEESKLICKKISEIFV
jgi:putative peptidoglycan lipid II flippase